jgi:ribosomal protein S12 methylthiotransferase RimO
VGKISLISLGCPKNLADSEKLVRSLREKGLGYSTNPEETDIILVNTCGFIEEAKKESVGEILRLAALKSKHKKRKLLVFGCLAKRYGEELKKEMPEIDAMWGVGEDKDIVEYCIKVLGKDTTSRLSVSPLIKGRNEQPHSKRGIKSVIPACPESFLKKDSSMSRWLRAIGRRASLAGMTKKKSNPDEEHRGILLIKEGHNSGDKFSDTPYAYLKIAEGCDRKCSYCIIPEIRGEFRSTRPEEIQREAERLIKSGIKELILVAQDITSYGKDLGRYDISRLIKEIASIKGDFWIRILYLYPTSITDKLIDTIKNEKKVCRYIDMPLQHSEDRILKLMGRGGSRQFHEKLILKLRKEIPDISLRTTLIVGFPGETDADFEKMEEFVREMRFDRLGVFRYSNEEGTGAYSLKGQVLKKIKNERYDRIMKIQSEISYEKNRSLIGKTYKALVDEVDKGIAIARIYSQTPEIDGVVMIRDAEINKGDFADVVIHEAYDYDLEGIVAV